MFGKGVQMIIELLQKGGLSVSDGLFDRGAESYLDSFLV